MLHIAKAFILKEVNSPAGYLSSTPCKNIPRAHEELLLWHATFGHYNIANTQKLISAVGVNKEPLLRPKNPGA